MQDTTRRSRPDTEELGMWGSDKSQRIGQLENTVDSLSEHMNKLALQVKELGRTQGNTDLDLVSLARRVADLEQRTQHSIEKLEKELKEVDREQRAHSSFLEILQPAIERVKHSLGVRIEKLYADVFRSKDILSVLGKASLHHGDRISVLEQALRSFQREKWLVPAQGAQVLYHRPSEDDE